MSPCQPPRSSFDATMRTPATGAPSKPRTRPSMRAEDSRRISMKVVAPASTLTSPCHTGHPRAVAKIGRTPGSKSSNNSKLPSLRVSTVAGTAE